MSNRGQWRSVGPYSGRGLRGRGGPSTPPGGHRSAHHHAPVEEDYSRANISPVPGDRMAQGRGKVTQQKSAVYHSQHSRHKPTPVCVYQPKLPSPGVDDELPNEIKLQKETDDPEAGNINSNQSDDPLASNSVAKDDHAIKTIETFDICPPKPAALMTLKPSLFEKNKERRKEDKRSREGKKGTVLRSGMVLLEKYLSLEEQAKIVEACRKLGLGRGGFYQPGYRDGAQLHLKMMCLGKFWDPETSKYGDCRPLDNVEPPSIPNEFRQLVEKAIEDSHALIKGESEASNVEDILPRMNPDICIVNFYSSSGRLGLHRDRDESQESIANGLPVVSFSIGDSCEFLYGDQRDADNANKVVLKSGDVLLFGGKSRSVFHGVTSIFSESAPKTLLEETNLRPGRLNLTFREY